MNDTRLTKRIEPLKNSKEESSIMNDTRLTTYIIITEGNEYYCGKTNDIKKRIQEHKAEKEPHWFAYSNRKSIREIMTFEGDIEKKIKTFGLRSFLKTITFAKQLDVKKLEGGV